MTTGIVFGIHDGITAAAYHADMAERPSLSSSVAALLVNASPKHAWNAHPRLNPDYRRVDKDIFDLGTCAHELLLRGDDIAEVLDFPDWRSNAAKDARDAARAAGRVPLLRKQWDEVRAMVDAAADQITAVECDPPLFAPGKPEQTVVWEEDGGVVCRARLDWLHDDHTAVDDYKSTSASASPERWTRTMFAIGADVQVAFYLRGLRAVTGREAVWRYVVQETYPPYALSAVTLDQEALAIGHAKVERALDLWRDCLASGLWPGYPAYPVVTSAPPWETRWLTPDEDLEAAAWQQLS